ncbi:polysaccharide deacetylase [Trinickia symbiotica]|uniref:Polysaccharide deacetylase n=1 Tax=Trinickia symbiotica TaxID=863227 RepID=A0A2T3XXD8_9BURK|nr:polysaccharide deacetylase family protein [Trinickia symbiotica]PTB21162.1 polysaccharide deacetylase [Trinickia symbiotica]
MIGILFPNASREAGHYVLAAMRRSVSAPQAQWIARSSLESPTLSMVVAVDVPDEWGAELLQWLRLGTRKLALFGRIPREVARYLNYESGALPAELHADSRSESAPSGAARESRAAVSYTALARKLGGQQWHRSFERFDFTDEWNNLGYGAIRSDGSMWSVAQAGHVESDAELASVTVAGERRFSYAALWDDDASSVLWFNRAVGPSDSFEWRIVEQFLSGYRSDKLPCKPVLSEVPWGYDAVITSRLDCDEDVESARPLWQAYRRLGIPFTLAVHTQNLNQPEHHAILRELLADGGAVLSHTATHAPNWGGSYDAALGEGRHSAALLEGVTGRRVRYAVSPFHQSPPYALQALADAGYEGCIGGIIRNDPEFVLARGGELAGLPSGFVGHSQQCMLHGDCMLSAADALTVFKRAFDLAYETRAMFGYLDHPFSERYQYGWRDEAVRIEAHEQFILYMKNKAAKPLFVNEEVALDFLRHKSTIQVVGDRQGFRIQAPPADLTPFAVGVEFRGAYLEAQPGKVLQ